MLPEPFIQILNVKLGELGYTSDKSSEIVTKIIEANQDYQKDIENKNKKKEPDAIDLIITKAFENPNLILEAIKPNKWKLLIKFVTVLTFVIAVVILALYGVLKTTETATLLGGIIGYVLGDASK